MPVKIGGTMLPEGTSVARSRDGAARVEGTADSFSAELMDQQDEGWTGEKLDAMMRRIDIQAAKLTKTPTYDELKEYRTLIKNFVGGAVSRMYELSTQAGWDRMGRQRVYTTVRKIDRKLEEMAEKIRLGQAEQLDVVASHDAIRGMLVDLYM